MAFDGFLTVDDFTATEFFQGNVVFWIADVRPYSFADTVRRGDRRAAGTKVNAEVSNFVDM